jgi:voltage-gated sodium channel
LSGFSDPGWTSTPRRWCQQVIASNYFEWLVAAVILTTAALIGLQADWGVHHPGEELPLCYRLLDNFTVMFFTLELILRIAAEGCAFFSPQNPEVRWNVFDSALVATSYWELLTASLGVSFIVTNVTRLLRLSRLVRAMRVIRIIRLFSELRIMVIAIGSSLRLLSWASCLLMMLMYIFAVSFVQIVENELAGAAEGADGAPTYVDHELLAHWGSLSRALYTLYMSITNGMSWDAAVEPLLRISPFLAGAFCVYIAIALFCVLNTITGIFCEKAIQIVSADEDCMMWNELDRRKAWVRDVKRLFRGADGGDNGRLEWEGFCKLLKDFQMQNILKSIGVDVMAVKPRMLFDLFDTDGSGTIEINEFADALQKLHGSAKAVDMATLKYKLMGMNKRMREIKEMLESQGFESCGPRVTDEDW